MDIMHMSADPPKGSSGVWYRYVPLAYESFSKESQGECAGKPPRLQAALPLQSYYFLSPHILHSANTPKVLIKEATTYWD